MGQFCSGLRRIVLYRMPHLEWGLKYHMDHKDWLTRESWCAVDQAACPIKLGMNWYMESKALFPELQDVTIVDSVIPMSIACHGDGSDVLFDGASFHPRFKVLTEGFSWRVPLLRIDWCDYASPYVGALKSVATVNMNALIWPYPDAQRQWVARIAPKLPPGYRELFAETTNPGCKEARCLRNFCWRKFCNIWHDRLPKQLITYWTTK